MKNSLRLASAFILIFATVAYAGPYDRRGFSMGLDLQYIYILDDKLTDSVNYLLGAKLNGRYIFKNPSFFCGIEAGYLHGSSDKKYQYFSYSAIPLMIGAGYEFLPKKIFNIEIGLFGGIVFQDYAQDWKNEASDFSHKQDIRNGDRIHDAFTLAPSIGFDIKWNRNGGVRIESDYLKDLSTDKTTIGKLTGLVVGVGAFMQF